MVLHCLYQIIYWKIIIVNTWANFRQLRNGNNSLLACGTRYDNTLLFPTHCVDSAWIFQTKSYARFLSIIVGSDFFARISIFSVPQSIPVSFSFCFPEMDILMFLKSKILCIFLTLVTLHISRISNFRLQILNAKYVPLILYIQKSKIVQNKGYITK